MSIKSVYTALLRYHQMVCVCDMSILSIILGKTTYAVGNDKKLKEIVDGQVTRSFDCGTNLTALAFLSSRRLFFAGTEFGAVRAYRYPLTGEVRIHHDVLCIMNSMLITNVTTVQLHI